jgi:mono/diheme cytochrome c family protein
MRATDLVPSSHVGRLSRFAAATLLLGWMLFLAGSLPVEGAEPGASQCVLCHTDAAKLKAMTPADPPPSEEGEG